MFSVVFRDAMIIDGTHSVEDALAVFFTSALDAMFIDDALIEKEVRS